MLTSTMSEKTKSVFSGDKSDIVKKWDKKTNDEIGAGNVCMNLSEGKRKIMAELAKRKMSHEVENRKQKQRKQMYVTKTKQLLDKQRIKKEIHILPDVDNSKQVIRQLMAKEEGCVLERRKVSLEEESLEIKQDINEKFGVTLEKDHPNMLALAKRFCGEGSDEGIPDTIRKKLTTGEIRDLRMVYDMFDVKGKGHITAGDLRRMATMIGFRAKKNVYDEMIGEITEGHSGQVTFINLLEFIVKVQEDGPDPLDHIIQGFNLLDTDDKGYITFDDLRRAADETEAGLSNLMIREMVEQADQRGDGKVMLEDFMKTMLMTDTFSSIDVGELILKDTLFNVC